MIGRKEDKYWFMTIFDKTNISETNFCPPHKFPHKILGDKITDEPCHYHKNPLRMAHHKPFCQTLECPHYQSMMEAYENEKAQNPNDFSLYIRFKDTVVNFAKAAQDLIFEQPQYTRPFLSPSLTYTNNL